MKIYYIAGSMSTLKGENKAPYNLELSPIGLLSKQSLVCSFAHSLSKQLLQKAVLHSNKEQEAA